MIKEDLFVGLKVVLSRVFSPYYRGKIGTVKSTNQANGRTVVILDDPPPDHPKTYVVDPDNIDQLTG